MVYINIAIIILLLLLALLSRKNKSKYKSKGCVLSVGLAMADYLYQICIEKLDKTGKHFKMIYTVPLGKEKIMAKEFAVKKMTVCISIIFLINILSIGYTVIYRENRDSENNIVRQAYDGNVEKYNLILKAADKEEIYTLNVFPVEYTKSEFDKQADLVFEGLCNEILGENTDTKHISTDLILPETDTSGLFIINWTSNHPEILSTSGRLNNLNISEGIEVELCVSIEYREFKKEYSMVLYVEPYKVGELSVTDTVSEILVELEEVGRTKRELQLPGEIDGVNVSVVKEQDNTQSKLLIIGLCLCIAYICTAYGKIREKSRRIEVELVDSYVGFIDSLGLLIESGMTVKGALFYLSGSDDICEKISKELKYAINMIDTGYEETYVYNLLGERLGIKIYSKLFNEIIHSVKKGNNNVRTVLNNYGYEAEQICRENIKKKGEQASTKLLIPMFMLLIIILLILVLPAILGF
ncbi:MAG: type II secretion system F family protein [Lachnospiraceae bacterium]|nr:type II secretion system F family protein [Lachnospiraceae bacterium]